MKDVYICHSTPQKVNDISMTAKEFVRNFPREQAEKDYCETMGGQFFFCPEGFRPILVRHNGNVSASASNSSTNEDTGKLAIRR